MAAFLHAQRCSLFPEVGLNNVSGHETRQLSAKLPIDGPHPAANFPVSIIPTRPVEHQSNLSKTVWGTSQTGIAAALMIKTLQSAARLICLPATAARNLGSSLPFFERQSVSTSLFASKGGPICFNRVQLMPGRGPTSDFYSLNQIYTDRKLFLIADISRAMHGVQNRSPRRYFYRQGEELAEAGGGWNA